MRVRKLQPHYLVVQLSVLILCSVLFLLHRLLLLIIQTSG